MAFSEFAELSHNSSNCAIEFNSNQGKVTVVLLEKNPMEILTINY
jgi:hypothetical protein